MFPFTPLSPCRNQSSVTHKVQILDAQYLESYDTRFSTMCCCYWSLVVQTCPLRTTSDQALAPTPPHSMEEWLQSFLHRDKQMMLSYWWWSPLSFAPLQTFLCLVVFLNYIMQYNNVLLSIEVFWYHGAFVLDLHKMEKQRWLMGNAFSILLWFTEITAPTGQREM